MVSEVVLVAIAMVMVLTGMMVVRAKLRYSSKKFQNRPYVRPPLHVADVKYLTSFKV